MKKTCYFCQHMSIDKMDGSVNCYYCDFDTEEIITTQPENEIDKHNVERGYCKFEPNDEWEEYEDMKKQIAWYEGKVE